MSKYTTFNVPEDGEQARARIRKMSEAVDDKALDYFKVTDYTTDTTTLTLDDLYKVRDQIERHYPPHPIQPSRAFIDPDFERSPILHAHAEAFRTITYSPGSRIVVRWVNEGILVMVERPLTHDSLGSNRVMSPLQITHTFYTDDIMRHYDEVLSATYVPDHTLTLALQLWAFDVVRYMAAQLELHECREWVKLDGQRLDNPHSVLGSPMSSIKSIPELRGGSETPHFHERHVHVALLMNPPTRPAAPVPPPAEPSPEPEHP